MRWPVIVSFAAGLLTGAVVTILVVGFLVRPGYIRAMQVAQRAVDLSYDLTAVTSMADVAILRELQDGRVREAAFRLEQRLDSQQEKLMEYESRHRAEEQDAGIRYALQLIEAYRKEHPLGKSNATR